MSNKYKLDDTIPDEVICARLDELSKAVSEGRDAVNREFTMRIPAECDRDADLVLAYAAKRLRELSALQQPQPANEQYNKMYAQVTEENNHLRDINTALRRRLHELGELDAELERPIAQPAAVTLPDELAARLRKKYGHRFITSSRNEHGDMCINKDNYDFSKHPLIGELLNCIKPAIAAIPEGVSAGTVPGWPIEQEPKYTTDGTHIINRVSGEKIPHDEPVMIFRARDKNAAPMIAFYKKLCRISEHVSAVRGRMHQFIDFMHAYPERMKEPDTVLSAAQSQGDAK